MTDPAGGDTAAKSAKTPLRRAPRMWLGANFSTWMRLLARNHFAVHPAYWYIAVADTLITAINSFYGGWQNLWLGRKIAATELTAPPVFIIGHWRTGTTLLHES